MRHKIHELSLTPRLADIGNFLTRLRIASRRITSANDADRATMAALEGEATALPDSLSALARASCVASIKAQCVTLRCKLRERREARLALGHALMQAAPLIDACTSLAERCELLNINAADRHGLTESDGIWLLVLAYALEDSAERRRAEFNDGPLFRLAHAQLAQLLATDEGRHAVGSAPGAGPFERPTVPSKLH
jgi:hypothetical protein